MQSSNLKRLEGMNECRRTFKCIYPPEMHNSHFIVFRGTHKNKPTQKSNTGNSKHDTVSASFCLVVDQSKQVFILIKKYIQSCVKNALFFKVVLRPCLHDLLKDPY